MIKLPDKLASSRNDGSKSVSEKNNSNGEIRFSGDGVKHVKKSRKLKGQKLAKFQKLSKLEKSKSEKLSKNRNSPNFDAIEAKPNFLTPNARITFNCL